MTSRLRKLAPVALALFLAPLAHRADAQAITCKDGTISAAIGRGACSGHGGVVPTPKHAVRAAKAETRAAKATAAAAANQVTCSDGSIGVAGRGACSGHGGINRGATNATRAVAQADVRAARADQRAVKRAVVANGLAEDNNPAGSIAKCKDGLYSHAQSRQGACSRHGGVAAWR
jgi:hypothetical protein